MKRLIINADDLGVTAGVTDGIVHAIDRGVVTSTSAMPCRQASLARIRDLPGELDGKVGVHLQLTAGTPLLPADSVPSLVQPSGDFPRRLDGEGHLGRDEVASEWCAQVEAVVASGLSPTHIDSHHSVHKREALVDVYCAVARRYGLKARGGSRALSARIRDRGVVCPDLCEASWSVASPTLDALRERLRTAFSEVGDEGVVELVAHPGYVDDELRRISGYSDGRDVELDVLCAAETSQLLDELGIERIGFSEL